MVARSLLTLSLIIFKAQDARFASGVKYDARMYPHRRGQCMKARFQAQVSLVTAL